jgi:hypothetical protein
MKYTTYLIIIGAFLLGSCQKEEVNTPKFDVASEIPFWSGNHSAKVNAEVKFLIDGKADFITFYSGELGKEYQYRDRINSSTGATIARDKGVAIKGYSENTLKTYSAYYPIAGTYTATFVGINHTTYGKEEVVVINIPIVITL